MFPIFWMAAGSETATKVGVFSMKRFPFKFPRFRIVRKSSINYLVSSMYSANKPLGARNTKMKCPLTVLMTLSYGVRDCESHMYL